MAIEAFAAEHPLRQPDAPKAHSATDARSAHSVLRAASRRSSCVDAALLLLHHRDEVGDDVLRLHDVGLAFVQADQRRIDRPPPPRRSASAPARPACARYAPVCGRSAITLVSAFCGSQRAGDMLELRATTPRQDKVAVGRADDARAATVDAGEADAARRVKPRGRRRDPDADIAGIAQHQRRCRWVMLPLVSLAKRHFARLFRLRTRFRRRAGSRSRPNSPS